MGKLKIKRKTLKQRKIKMLVKASRLLSRRCLFNVRLVNAASNTVSERKLSTNLSLYAPKGFGKFDQPDKKKKRSGKSRSGFGADQADEVVEEKEENSDPPKDDKKPDKKTKKEKRR